MLPPASSPLSVADQSLLNDGLKWRMGLMSWRTWWLAIFRSLLFFALAGALMFTAKEISGHSVERAQANAWQARLEEARAQQLMYDFKRDSLLHLRETKGKRR